MEQSDGQVLDLVFNTLEELFDEIMITVKFLDTLFVNNNTLNGASFASVSLMKIIYLQLLIFFLSSHVLAESVRLNGSAISGSISLSGFAKNLINKKAIPLGSIKSFYGYEAINFSSLLGRDSKAKYCFAGVGQTSGSQLLGLSFGGNIGNFQTFDRCERPENYEGGFLNLGISYDFQDKQGGSKSTSVDLSINLGFNLANLIQKLELNYRYSPNGMSQRTKLLKAVTHLAKYTTQNLSSKVIAPTTKILLKLMLLPYIPFLEKETDFSVTNFFTQSEMNILEQWTKKTSQNSTLKDNLSSAIYNIRRDSKFYECKLKTCDETLVDTLTFLEALEESLGDCHAIALSLNLESSYSFSIPFYKPKLHYSYGYSYYALNGTSESKLSTSILATKQFLGHNINKKSPTCQNTTSKAASGFASFLSFFQ